MTDVYHKDLIIGIKILVVFEIGRDKNIGSCTDGIR